MTTKIYKKSLTPYCWVSDFLMKYKFPTIYRRFYCFLLLTLIDIFTSIAHPREIFRGAVRISAARIILGHNHPSGNPEPSQADISFTKRIIECGELMGIDLLDHIVVGEKGYISLKETGII